MQVHEYAVKGGSNALYRISLLDLLNNLVLIELCCCLTVHFSFFLNVCLAWSPRIVVANVLYYGIVDVSEISTTALINWICDKSYT